MNTVKYILYHDQDTDSRDKYTKEEHIKQAIDIIEKNVSKETLDRWKNDPVTHCKVCNILTGDGFPYCSMRCKKIDSGGEWTTKM